MTTQAEFHDALIAVMSEPRRRFKPATDVVAAVAPAERRYIAAAGSKTEIRVAGHADFEVDALIHDGEIGSLGLVHFLTAAGEDEVRKAIDDAAYLRHLLLEEASSGIAAATPYTVEVVLAVDPKDATTAAAIGEVLNDVLREGSYLHAVGVNLWRAGENGSLTDEVAVRRAFAWLLGDTELWLGRRPGGAANEAAAKPVESVTLTDVRVPGERVFELAGEHQLHLIHGHNGSGKSSFCEALELVTTSKVARLRDPRETSGYQDHRDVLTSRGAANGSATITVRQRGDTAARSWTVAADGVASALKPQLNADAFRLDQSVADRLIQGSAAERARIFLDAFFPDDATARLAKTHREAREAFDKLLPKVAATLAGPTTDPSMAFDAAIKRAATELQWLDAPQQATCETFLRLMPLDRELVRDLGAMIPKDAADRYERTGPIQESDMTAAAQAIDSALRAFGNDLKQMIEVATQSTAVLTQLAEVTVSGATDTGEDLETRLRTWQRLHALTDLLEREDQILSTIEIAVSHGYAINANDLFMSASTVSPTARTNRIAEARTARDNARHHVLAFESETERKAKREQPAGVRDALDRVSVLSRAAMFGIFGAAYRQCTPPLGEAVRTALQKNDAVAVSSGSTVLVRVGEPGWAKELLELVRKSADALARADQRSDELPVTKSLDGFATLLRTFRKAAAEIEEFDKLSVDRFADVFKADGPLGRAVNELTALLTPARWAYRDVIPNVDVSGADQHVELYAGVTRADGTPAGVSAKFVLNTAELNTLALAIFLLCARRIDNPLRVLVLDDPLQNMDELTVTTIARGVGRVLRLWRRHLDGAASPWRMFILLHGEDDMERIRREVPCAVHLLPWLSPRERAAGRQHPRVESEPARLQETLQPLAKVVTTP